MDIILPCYNVDKYITNCLNSIYGQKTNYKIRLIVINDGSSDETKKLIELSKNNCPFELVIIHQNNKGLSGARNAGLELLDSKYIMFIDSDDSLAGTNAIDSLLSVAFFRDADIVEGSINYINNNKVSGIKQHENGILSVRDLCGQVWGKVIKSNLFQKICFPSSYWFEDSIMAQLVYPQVNCEKVFGIDTFVYNYTSNSHSITHQAARNNKCIDSLYVTLRLYDDRRILNLNNTQEYYEYILRMSRLSLRRMIRMPYKVKKAFFDIYSDFIMREFSNFNSCSYHLLEWSLKKGWYFLFYLICLK